MQDYALIYSPPQEWGGTKGEVECITRRQMKSLLPLTKALRTNQTPWEAKLWYHLRGNRFYGLKFKRQVQIGKYIVDLCCNQKKLVIELDGGQHTSHESNLKDQQRTTYLKNQGYQVLRFNNTDIDTNLEGVLQSIKDALR